MRILVCGGRDFLGITQLYRVLDASKMTHLVTGGARGVDKLAEEWARDRMVPYTVYPANWDKYGPAAGPVRNQQMLDEGKPDKVIAFPGGKGTSDMIRRAQKAGIPVEVV